MYRSLTEFAAPTTILPFFFGGGEGALVNIGFTNQYFLWTAGNFATLRNTSTFN